jgi:hypothetical protein
MVTRLVVIIFLGTAMILALSARSYGKRGSPTTTTAPADNRLKGKSLDDYDVEDDVPPNVRTGKDRAREFEKGKPVDKSKTSSQLDRLTGKVSSLDAALRNTKTAPKTASKYQSGYDEDVPTARRKSRQPATEPATQPAKSTKAARNRYFDDE